MPLLALALLAAASANAEPFHLIPGSFEEGRQPDANSIILDAPQGLIVINTGRHKAQQEKILDFAADRGKPIAAIINTHWHLDHTGGNQEIRAVYPKARIIASNAIVGALAGFLKDSRKGAEEYLATGKVSPEQEAEVRGDFAAMDDTADLIPTDPVTKTEHRKVAGRPLDIHLARNAVTEGDVWVYDPRTKTVITGTLVNSYTPFFDTVCVPGWLRALKQIEAVPFTTLVPGQGKPMNRAQYRQWETAFHHFLDCADSKAPKADCIAGWKRDAAQFLAPLGNAKIDGLLGYYVDVRLRGPERDKYCPVAKAS
ncbi:MAG: MBL fold metallo-hydrolase [Sphingomonas sp.]